MLHRIQLHFQQQVLDNPAMSWYLVIHWLQLIFTQMTRKYGRFAKHEDGTPSSFQIHNRHLWHSNSMCPDMACDRGLLARWSVSTTSLLVWHFVIVSRCQSWASQHQDGFVRPLVAVHSDVTGRWPNLGMNISHIDRFWSRPWSQWWRIWRWWISVCPSEETDKERQGGFRLRSPCRKVFQQFVRFLDLQQRGCKEIT